MIPNWTNEQRKLVCRVASLWSKGCTQEQIAEELGMPVSTLRSKLLAIGVKYGRVGKLIWAVSDDPIDEKHIASAA